MLTSNAIISGWIYNNKIKKENAYDRKETDLMSLIRMINF